MAAGIAASVFVPWPGHGPMTLFVLLPAVAGTGLLMARMIRAKVRDRFLDRHGVLTTAVVIQVEPLSWNVNNAAGHPVRLRVDTPDGVRTLRDTTGLNGYVVPEGAEVRVRVSLTDPDLFRVEELPGGFQVDQDRPLFYWFAASVLVLLVLASVFLVGSVTEALQGVHRMDRFSYPSLAGAFGVLLLCYAVHLLFTKQAFSERVESEVTALNLHQSHDSFWYSYAVRFRTADNRMVHKVSGGRFDSNHPPIGRMPVWYRPDRPTEFLVRAARRDRPSRYHPLLLLFLGLLFTVAGFLRFLEVV